MHGVKIQMDFKQRKSSIKEISDKSRTSFNRFLSLNVFTSKKLAAIQVGAYGKCKRGTGALESAIQSRSIDGSCDRPCALSGLRTR